jgi:hypothetical protein
LPGSKTAKPGWSRPGFFASDIKVIMRLFCPINHTIEFDPVTREMNNFDKWIRITYAECVDFGVPRIMGM